MGKMDKGSVIFVFLCLMAPCDIFVESLCRNYERITDNLREVIIGMCEMFQQMIKQEIFCEHGFRNCTVIWEKLSSAFRYKPVCNVSAIGYEEYVNLTDHPLPRDKGLLWENVYPFVIGYTGNGQKFYALSDTLSGYLGNGPMWCSDPNTNNGLASPGTECPGWYATPDCPMSASRAFWIAVSKRFSENLNGHVYVMLNASTVPIYANNTYLAEHEMPYLRRNAVTKVTVLLVNESPVQHTTKCTDPSLQILEGQVKGKDFAYDCIENPPDIVNQLCQQDSSLGMCSFVSSTSASSALSAALLLILSSVLIRDILQE